MAIEKIKILGAVLEPPAKQHCQFGQILLAPMATGTIKILGAILELPDKQYILPIQPIWPIFVVNGLDWQCFLVGSSKTAPRILIFSIAIVADYSFEMKNSEIWVPAFFRHNKSFIAAV